MTINTELLRQKILSNQPVTDEEIAEAIRYTRESREQALGQRKRIRSEKGIKSKAEADFSLDAAFAHLKPIDDEPEEKEE